MIVVDRSGTALNLAYASLYWISLKLLRGQFHISVNINFYIFTKHEPHPQTCFLKNANRGVNAKKFFVSFWRMSAEATVQVFYALK